MANCAIVGINWGDEGKGRMVDLLASEYDVVVRYQGGNNAGHTVINQYGKFALHLIPSGIFRPEVINLLGNGTVIDPEALLLAGGGGIHHPGEFQNQRPGYHCIPLPPGPGRPGGGAAQGRQIRLHQAGHCAGIQL